ncbi:hypothetical protein WMY93_017560 [Mugilogobius chulae]|uniref:Uncharacterized protein n=1 Tax=Mugilogobius chulae TaxID=88201 RepID=A0AAW0NRD1_9GOBI
MEIDILGRVLQLRGSVVPAAVCYPPSVLLSSPHIHALLYTLPNSFIPPPGFQLAITQHLPLSLPLSLCSHSLWLERMHTARGGVGFQTTCEDLLNCRGRPGLFRKKRYTAVTVSLLVASLLPSSLSSSCLLLLHFCQLHHGPARCLLLRGSQPCESSRGECTQRRVEWTHVHLVNKCKMAEGSREQGAPGSTDPEEDSPNMIVYRKASPSCYVVVVVVGWISKEAARQ